MIENSCSLYSSEKINFKKEPIFLGKGKNTQRFDDPKYPFFDKSNDDQQGQDWKHDEVPLIDDTAEFKTILRPPEKHVTTRTLQKLIFFDSLQGRGPMLIFGQITTLPELENVILTWTYFEAGKHSRTYTEELRALYDNPDEIFDESFDIPELMATAASVKGPYERAYFNVIGYIYREQRGIENTEEDIRELQESLIMCMIEINALEGIRFYPGFAAIWAITEGQKLLDGTSENLQFICRDENSHLALTQFILKLMRREDGEGFTKTYARLQPKIMKRYIEIFNEEKDWFKVLFEKGSFIGMNSDILTNYLNHITIKRMWAIGLDPKPEDFNGLFVTKNNIPWIDKFINMDEVEKLPQQQLVLNYITGAIEQDISKYELPSFVNELIK